ncbi:MAG: hypothetical protein EBR64_07530 [Burkholderiaceae bacterium]|nr:hypothetical protein [Burkholderiaceae bacterium]
MRDYTYIEGYRFIIWNIYRSKRFDVDRLDINFADKDMPEFVRGLRIVDHLENESYTVHGEDATACALSITAIKKIAPISLTSTSLKRLIKKSTSCTNSLPRSAQPRPQCIKK